MSRALLLVAMKEELAPFLARCRTRGDVTVRGAGRGRWTLEHPGASYDVVLSGPGYDNTLGALADVSPTSIVQAGFAGSLRGDLERLEVCRVAAVRRGEELLAIPEVAGSRFAALPPATVVTAPGIMRAADKLRMSEDGAGDLVDMETHAAVACALDEGIAYSGIRVVSDGLADELPQALVDVFDGRRFRTWPLIRRSLVDRTLRRELLGLRRRAREAAERLASVLDEGLFGSVR